MPGVHRVTRPSTGATATVREAGPADSIDNVDNADDDIDDYSIAIGQYGIHLAVEARIQHPVGPGTERKDHHGQLRKIRPAAHVQAQPAHGPQARQASPGGRPPIFARPCAILDVPRETGLRMESTELDLWTIRDICRELRIGRSTLAVYRRAGRFPEPLRMPPGAKRPRLRWTRAAIAEWVTRGQS